MTITLRNADALSCYAAWPRPTVIIADGAYGLGLFSGDPHGVSALVPWYRPHIQHWSAWATSRTTLWFWNTEVGWATVHPELVAQGWRYKALHVWDKGIAHIAGRVNSQTVRGFPVVTEVCAQYIRPPVFRSGDHLLSAQTWLRQEWLRTGLPLAAANVACGVRDAATRKYLTTDHVWYMPPPAMFMRLADYANRHGDGDGRPYFTLDGAPATAGQWERLWHVWHHEHGVTNVWHEPALRSAERVRGLDGRVVHANQKPLALMQRIIAASSDPGDAVWEPFGGLCTAALAAHRLDRHGCAAEHNPTLAAAALFRITESEALCESIS